MAKSDEKVFTADELQNAVKSAAKAIAEEMIPAMAAMVQVNQQGQNQGRQSMVHVERCQECGQAKRGCGGEHVQMVVFPTKYPEFGEWFQGCWINGVRYLSNDAGHTVTVPKNAQGGLTKMVQDFENNEREQRMGKTREWNSGSVSSPRRPAQVDGWR